jgi:hypothetical protein
MQDLLAASANAIPADSGVWSGTVITLNTLTSPSFSLAIRIA